MRGVWLVNSFRMGLDSSQSVITGINDRDDTYIMRSLIELLVLNPIATLIYSSEVQRRIKEAESALKKHLASQSVASLDADIEVKSRQLAQNRAQVRWTEATRLGLLINSAMFTHSQARIYCVLMLIDERSILYQCLLIVVDDVG